MQRRHGCSRRRVLSLSATLGVGGVAGCLRLEDEADDPTEGSDSDTQPGTDSRSGSDDGTSENDSDETDGDDPAVELAPAWDTEERRGEVTTAEGDFFLGASRLYRIRPDGTVVFESASFDDNHSLRIGTSKWNTLYADESGVYVGSRFDDDGDDGGRVYALDPDNGERQWTFDVPHDGLHNTVRAITAIDDLVICASANSATQLDEQEPVVQALDADTGEERWRISYSEGDVAGLFVYDGRLFVQRLDWLHRYDPDTQEELDAVEIRAAFNRAALRDGTLYWPGERWDDTVRALELPSMEERWATDTDYAVNTAAAVGDSRLFVGTDAGFVLAYDRDTGDRLWETRADGSVQHAPIVEDGLVWVTSDARELAAYDIADGERRYEEQSEEWYDFDIQDGILLDNRRETAFEIQ